MAHSALTDYRTLDAPVTSLLPSATTSTGMQEPFPGLPLSASVREIWLSGRKCNDWSFISLSEPFSSGHCYKTGSIYNCRDVAQQQEEEEEETTEGM